jgi:branched-subunit amino acid transport protein
MAQIWLTLIIAGTLTYLTRLSFIALLDRWQLPPIVLRALRFVPPAVLSAIIFPELFIRSGIMDVSLNNFRLIAGVIAALVGWRTRNIFLTIAAGMAALYLLQWSQVLIK